MDSGSKEKNISTIPVPESVTIAQVHNFFKVKYELDDGEAETLIASSSKSLIEFITAAETMWVKGGQRIPSDELQALLHRGKGLLLIMGQEEWALYVTALNVSDPDTIYDSIQKVMNNVRQGFSDIITC